VLKLFLGIVFICLHKLDVAKATLMYSIVVSYHALL
jgi:hypothetical protein